MVRLMRGIALCILLAGFAGCTGSVPDPHYPYGAYTETVVGTMTGTIPLMGAATVQAGIVGEAEINGRNYGVYLIGTVPDGSVLNASTPGTAGYVRGLGTDTIEIGGFTSELGITGIAADPVRFNLDPPVGVPQSVSATSNITTTYDPVGRPATFEATYTLVQEGVTVNTSQLGTVAGVKHFQGNVAVSGEAIPAAYTGSAFDVEVWYHPDFGVVDVKSPQLGLDLGQEGQNDWTEPDANGVTVGRMLAVLDAGNPDASLSTYDRAQAFDADMCVHTKMLAEVRWANESDALTLGQPDPNLFSCHFNGGWGQFCWGGCPLVESAVSWFHPAENGKGYRFFYAYVDQALKNEYVEGGDKGSVYSIDCQTDPSLPPVRVTARIATTLASDKSDCSM